MKKSRIITEYGRDSVYSVIFHGYIKLRNGRFPSMAFDGTKDPRMALSKAYRMLKASTDASPLPDEVEAKISAFIRPERRLRTVSTRIRTERKAHVSIARSGNGTEMKKLGQDLARQLVSPPMTIVIRYEKHRADAKVFAASHFPASSRITVNPSPRKFIDSMADKKNYFYFDPTKKSGKTASSKDEQTGLPKRPTVLDHALEHDTHIAGIV